MFYSLDSPVCITIKLWTECPGFDSRVGQDILFCLASRPALGSIQPPLQLVLRDLVSRGKWAGA